MTTRQPTPSPKRSASAKSFGKRPLVLDVPPLLAIQTDSYREFLQENKPEIASRRPWSACGAEIGVPDLQLFRQCRARIRQLSPRRTAVRRTRVPFAWHELRRAAARARAPGDLRQGQPGQQQGREVRQGAGSLHGRIAAHDRHRHLHHQRHRARHRVAAASFAGRVLRSRPRQDAQLRQAAVFGAHHSLSRLMAGFRVRSRRTRCSRVSTVAANCR